MGGGLNHQDDPAYNPYTQNQTGSLDQPRSHSVSQATNTPNVASPSALPRVAATPTLVPVSAPAPAPPPAVVYVPVAANSAGATSHSNTFASQQVPLRRRMTDCTLIWWMVFFLCFCPLSLIALPCFLDSYREKEPVPQPTTGNQGIVVVQQPARMAQPEVDLEKGVAVHHQTTRVG
ncbi:uncharacterized protein SAPINGB_P004359 [Magnusiomyces paraingens]|uniref:Uncharacterized protein n=1 Tax=Magnusiomyces paraingens TaxID=2606893 RepID=A0A5E8BV45_9ASCO|nr:uncharacterized protein SAPINGB_P004359 [Saprochaete ingens]VVT54981.1 unnamed protein product [Saprochaete ingens]